MNKTLTVILLVLLSSLAALGQTSFLGLEPGKGTKADVERVLGQPVNKISETLWEYKSRVVPLRSSNPVDSGPIFVQWRKSVPPVVERIELLCDERCIRMYGSMVGYRQIDASQSNYGSQAKDPKTIYFYGSPVFVVTTQIFLLEEKRMLERLSFYTKELYEAAVANATPAPVTNKAVTDANTSGATGTARLAAANAFGPMREGYDLNGENYKVFDLAEPRPEMCQAECAHDAQCKGYTYVKPGTYNYPKPRCWLKSSVGTMFLNGGAVSGVKIQ